jgi:hypothetical protein
VQALFSLLGKMIEIYGVKQPDALSSPRLNMLKDYCELVDTTGWIIREDKAGHINHHYNPILDRLGLSDKQWLTLTIRQLG